MSARSPAIFESNLVMLCHLMFTWGVYVQEQEQSWLGKGIEGSRSPYPLPQAPNSLPVHSPNPLRASIPPLSQTPNLISNSLRECCHCPQGRKLDDMHIAEWKAHVSCVTAEEETLSCGRR